MYMNWKTFTSTCIPKKILKRGFLRPPNEIMKIEPTKYLCFVDLEPQQLIRYYLTVDYIPNIKKISFMFCIYDDFIKKKYEQIKFTYIDFNKFDITNLEIINNILEQPIFIAHNGYSFDFRILLAHYIHKFNKPLHLNLMDSLYQYKQKNSGHSMKNGDLFIRYSVHYPHKLDIINKMHNPRIDNEMTSLWVYYLQSQLQFAYISTQQFIELLQRK